MAKLKKKHISGTVNGVTYRQTANGTVISKKSSLDGQRFATDPAFARSRQNSNEFGLAAKNASLLFRLFTPHMRYDDPKIHPRALKEFFEIIKMDQLNPRGQRQVLPEHLHLLTGFRFSQRSRLDNRFPVCCTPEINLRKSTAEVNIQPFVPVNQVDYPPAATHFRLLLLAASVDVQALQGQVQEDSTGYIPIEYTVRNDLRLHCSGLVKKQPVILAMGIEFCKMDCGQYYPLGVGYNAYSIIAVKA